MQQVVTLPGGSFHRRTRMRFYVRPYEEIYHVLAVPVDECGDRAVVDVVEAPAGERKPGRRKVGDGWRKIEF